MNYSPVKTFFLLLASSVAGCAVYPTSRTSYELDPADGIPSNRASCGYTSTHDSARRVVERVDIFIFPGDSEDLSTNSDPGLEVGVTFHVPIDMKTVEVDAGKIKIEVDNQVLDAELSSSPDREVRRVDGIYIRKSFDLKFPPPSGIEDSIAISFLSGALMIEGRIVEIQPFRFRRVTQKDIYYGSINC